MTKPPVPRRPMSPEEIAMAKALVHVNFGMQSATRRFAERMNARTHLIPPDISDNEAWYLRDCVHTFRKQIPAHVVAHAGDVLAERKLRAAGAVARMADYEQAKRDADADRAAVAAQAKPPSAELDLFAGGAS